MSAARTCRCGAPLPKDKRVKRCDACAGEALRKQDNERHARQLLKARGIDWSRLGLAVCMKLEDIRRTDPRVQALVEEIAAERSSMAAKSVGRAVRGCVLRPHELTRVLAYLDRPAEDFKHGRTRAARARYGRAA